MNESLGCMLILCLYSTITAAHSDILHEIVEYTNGTEDAVQFSNVETLLSKLNFKKCTKVETTKCSLCATATDIYNQRKLNKSDTLSNNAFNDILTDILYLIVKGSSNINSSVVCKNVTSNQLIDVYSHFMNQYGSHDGHLEGEESLEKILNDIESSVGEVLTSEECFSAHDVIKASNSSEHSISKEQFNDVTAYIILKLLQGKCIKDDHETGEKLPDQADFVQALFEKFGNESHMSHDQFEELLRILKLGSKSSETKEHGHHGHDHKRKKRSVIQRYRRDADGHDHGHKHDNDSHASLNKCFSAENLLTIFNVPEESYVDIAKFEKMSPALIQQLQSGACSVDEHKSVTKDKSKAWQAWVGSMVSIFIISLGSLIGVVATPFTRKFWFPYVIMFLIALAVAVLVGDAILHLLPHSLGLHGHEEHGGGHEEHDENEQLKSDSFLWKCVCFLVGIYAFFTFELLMHAFGGGHSHSHEGEDKKESSDREISAYGNGIGRRRSSLQQSKTKGTLRMTEDLVENRYRGESVIINPSGMLEYIEEKPKENGTKDDTVHFDPAKDHVVFSPSRDNLVESSKGGLSLKDFKSVAWLVLIGDGVHNFLDGLAIGVAFSESWPSGLHGGISTSIAIFCHELPHELGDFAVLIASGLSIKQALLLNYISSLLSFLGGIVGCAIGSQWNATFWIFSITAGLFIYIALADMLPEALHSENLKRHPWISILMLQTGLLLGFAIMFMLGAWEENIKTAFT